MSIFQTNNLIDSALTMGTGQYMAKLASAVDTYVFDNFTTLAGSLAGRPLWLPAVFRPR